MCDNGYNVTFRSRYYEIHSMKNIKFVGREMKMRNNLYVFDNSKLNCYLTKTNEARFWKKRLGHINFDSLIKFIKMGYVKGIPIFSKPNNSINKSCQFGKHTSTHFKTKEFSSSRPLDLIHVDIFGSNRTKNIKLGR